MANTPAPTTEFRYPIETNFPRRLTSEQIAGLRDRAIYEAQRVMNGDPIRCDPIIQVKQEHPIEAAGRMAEMQQQLEISLRHIAERFRLDQYICGDERQKLPGTPLPVLRVLRSGAGHAVVETANTLDRLYQGIDDRDEQWEMPAIARDAPILDEDDRVDIVDAFGGILGGATVREVHGSAVSLLLHKPCALTAHECYLRKRSQRRLLRLYWEAVLRYCDRLHCAYRMTDRNGRPFWNKETGKADANAPFSTVPVRSIDLLAPLRPPERYFFGDERTSDLQAETIMSQRYVDPHDIPRSTMDDEEQAAAWTLAAMSHPCSAIHGPPGTGKTWVISLLAKYLQLQKRNVLVVSHTNRATDVLLGAMQQQGVRVLRGGNDARRCDPALRSARIRRSLTPPRKEDYITLQLDEDAFIKMKNACDSAGLPPPLPRDFMRQMLDRNAWRAAWNAHKQEVDAIGRGLREECGLVIGETLNTLVADEIVRWIPIDTVIVDEASKGWLYEMLPALEMARAQFICVGDHAQLRNIPLSQEMQSSLAGSHVSAADIARFQGGPFAAMMEHPSAIPTIMLKSNRRSYWKVVKTVSETAYDDRLKAGRVCHDDPAYGGQLTWIDTSGRPDGREASVGASKVNDLEARAIARALRKHYERGTLAPGVVLAITMYRAQMHNVLRHAARTYSVARGRRRRAERRESVTDTDRDHQEFLRRVRQVLETVDSSQGSEADHVIIGTTRTDQIGFLADTNRLNVAFSRARDSLTIVGDSQALIAENDNPESKRFFRILHEMCSLHGRVMNIWHGLPAEQKPEDQKSQTRRAKYLRKKREKKRQITDMSLQRTDQPSAE